MQTVRLRALASQNYMGRALRVGDQFDTDPRQAEDLVAMNFAEREPEPASIEPQPIEPAPTVEQPVIEATTTQEVGDPEPRRKAHQYRHRNLTAE